MKRTIRVPQKDGRITITPTLLKLIGSDSEYDAIQIVYFNDSLQITIVECPECHLAMQWDNKKNLCFCPNCNLELPREEILEDNERKQNFRTW